MKWAWVKLAPCCLSSPRILPDRLSQELGSSVNLPARGEGHIDRGAVLSPSSVGAPDSPSFSTLDGQGVQLLRSWKTPTCARVQRI